MNIKKKVNGYLLKQFPAGSLRSMGLPELELGCIKPSRWHEQVGCIGGSCADPSRAWLSRNGMSTER
jgi:hypothetical protein